MQEVFENVINEIEKARAIYFLTIANTGDKSLDVAYEKVGQAIDKAIEIVKQEEEQYKGGWIPVSDKLPEESLNSVIGWDEYRERCCFVQYIGGRWILGNDIDSVKIIAWQPLPQPYQPKGE